jgi:hypothetical protein
LQTICALAGIKICTTPHMLGLDIISYLHKHVSVVFVSYFFSTLKKKIGGEDAEFFIYF